MRFISKLRGSQRGSYSTDIEFAIEDRKGKCMYISLKDISLKIGENVILNHIDAEWEKGKIYGIAGRNGSGKTMLFRILCGFWKPTSGEVIVAGVHVGQEIEFIQNAGVVIGETKFISGISGMENLRLLAEIRNEIGDYEIEQTLKSVGLYEERNKKYRKYSLGMKQKLRLAQALMENPEILILDEPFNGLDKESVEKVQNLLLQKKKEGTTIFLASHIAADLDKLCDEVYEIENGVMQ